MRKLLYSLLTFLFFLSLAFSQPQKAVYVIPVKGIIDLGLSGFIKRALNEAKQANAQTVILEIDTFGGRVDAAVEITDALEKVKPIPTIAFIDDQAWSAGALIALACEKIIMSSGASIGSAEPRAMGFGGKDELTDEKTVSAIRAKFKALAEQNNHPLNLALSMVDKDFELKQIKVKGQIQIVTAQEIEELKSKYKESEIQILKTINPKGKLLNLTAGEAKELGLAQEVLASKDKLFEFLGLTKLQIEEPLANWSEKLVRFLTHPMLSPLLLMLGFLGIFYELQIPGWGISGTLGVICLALFFWGHYLVGLANWTEILIFILGVILLALEIFVIPGFGITGASGILLILVSIFLALIKHPFEAPKIQLVNALSTLGYALVFTVTAVILSLKFLPKSSFWKKIILSSEETKQEGFSSAASLEAYLGKTGKTITILRPSGRAVFESQTLDVISQGDFIEKDKNVKVVSVQGSKLVVEEEKIA